jgi:hypothetical protein
VNDGSDVLQYKCSKPHPRSLVILLTSLSVCAQLTIRDSPSRAERAFKANPELTVTLCSCTASSSTQCATITTPLPDETEALTRLVAFGRDSYGRETLSTCSDRSVYSSAKVFMPVNEDKVATRDRCVRTVVSSTDSDGLGGVGSDNPGGGGGGCARRGEVTTVA